MPWMILFDLDDDSQVDGVQVIGVHQLESIFTYTSSKKGAVKKTSTTTGTCQQCATVQRLKDENLTCKLFLEAGEEHLTVRAYEDVLTAIVEPNKFITCKKSPVVTSIQPQIQRVPCAHLG